MHLILCVLFCPNCISSVVLMAKHNLYFVSWKKHVSSQSFFTQDAFCLYLGDSLSILYTSFKPMACGWEPLCRCRLLAHLTLKDQDLLFSGFVSPLSVHYFGVFIPGYVQIYFKLAFLISFQPQRSLFPPLLKITGWVQWDTLSCP